MRRNWRKEAQTAIEAIKNSKYGEREAELRALARQFGYKSDDPSSLRRGMAAHEFLEKLRVSHPSEYEDLRDVPLSVAELIARWFTANPARALETARDFGRGKGTVSSIRRMMEETLPKGHGGLIGAARERAYRAAAVKPVSLAVAQLTGSEIVASKTRQRDPLSGLKVDFMFEVAAAKGSKKIAVLVVGPYKNATMYRDRCDEWIARAFGLAWVVDRVLLAVPVQDYVQMYRDRAALVAEASRRILGATADAPGEIRFPNVDAIHIEVDPFDPADSEAVGLLKR
jgi:hypothetical protein